MSTKYDQTAGMVTTSCFDPVVMKMNTFLRLWHQNGLLETYMPDIKIVLEMRGKVEDKALS